MHKDEKDAKTPPFRPYLCNLSQRRHSRQAASFGRISTQNYPWARIEACLTFKNTVARYERG
jgi:hypothetical protein